MKYEFIKELVPAMDEAVGPSIDIETFFSSPDLQEELLQELIFAPRRQFSDFLSQVLDGIGYSYGMIRRRQHIRLESSTPYDKYRNHPIQLMFTGGKGEGTSLLYENDIDQMIILSDTICSDNPQEFINEQSITLCHTERENVSPGYTRLKIIKQSGVLSKYFIQSSICENETGTRFISSRMFTTTIGKQYTKPTDVISGPSVPIHGEHKESFDMVFAFRCYCPDVLKKWLARKRYHGWPSPKILQEISNLDGHVVPVGFKGSPDADKEWRICYTFAELHLMHNMHGIQLKVYILLKKLCKSALTPICRDMTSYVMKNVVFWICEENGLEKFTNDSLMDRFLDAVNYIKKCVGSRNLPSYMIPERNLLAGKLDNQTQKDLIRLLDKLLEEGGRMFLKCEELRDAMLTMYKVPLQFKEFSRKRDEIETALLERYMTRATTQGNPNIPEEKANQIAEDDREMREEYIDSLLGIPVQTLRKDGKSTREIKELRELKIRKLLSP